MNGRRYPDEVRARGIELYQHIPLAEASRELGVPKSTIVRWAKAAGVHSAEVTAANRARTEAATEAAQLELARRVAEGRAQLIPKLVTVANDALDAERAVLGALKAVQKEALEDQRGGITEAAVARLEAVLSGPRLRDLVGARTRAVHDLQLLTGEETERGAAGPVTVVFATAARDEGAEPPRIVDLPPPLRALPSS